MGNKVLSYRDAAELLGAKSPMLARLSTLVGTGLTIASAGVSDALGLFDLKQEVDRLGQEATVTLRNRFKGLNRFQRSELLEAAHAVLVVSAFFAALDDLDRRLGSALNTASLELTRAEQAGLATGADPRPGAAGLAELARQLIIPNAVPGLGSGWPERGVHLISFYQDLAGRIGRFAAGTAVWDERDETTRDRWSTAVAEQLPRQALAQYEQRLGQLAGEFPEFAFWAQRVGVQTVLDQLYAIRQDTGELAGALRSLAELIRPMTHGTDPSKVRRDLVTEYRRQIDRPIAGATDVSAEVRLPALRSLYVDPSYQTRPVGAADQEWIGETGWYSAARRDDLWALVVQHLISTNAARVPLVLLGQPGAGKSVFTQMLAAELDPRDYLVVRVELRAVASDASLQRQIETALEHLTGRRLPWPELANDVGQAQPVILLDGFDELLQASGVEQFGFLERVQEFQEREASLGRPVAVVVTSRTAVANQVRYPGGTVVVRLETFDDDQVGRWLSAWNETNPARPLPAQTALAQGDLARQPLLLFMLALFHSGGSELTPGISQAQLYEKLFVDFADRDVTKHDAQISARNRWRAVQRELDLLSMVAFAMFNRGQQMVTEADLRADLTALEIGASTDTEPPPSDRALDIVQKLAGRFFFKLFVQQAQATHGQQTRHSAYEFLHTSFGEFLIARWVVGELTRLAELDRLAADHLYRPQPDDARLHALLSVAVLSTREQRVLEFISQMLTGKSVDDLAELRTLMTGRFHNCLRPREQERYSQYRPVQQAAPVAYAAYSANLLLLLLLITEAEAQISGQDEHIGLTVAELYGPDPAKAEPDEHRARWRSLTRLWHAQLNTNEWDGLLKVIRLTTVNQTGAVTTDTPRQLRVSRWKPTDYHQQSISGRALLPDLSQLGRDTHDVQLWFDDPASQALREAALLDSPGYQDACAALLPYQQALGVSQAATRFQLGSQAADMISLLLIPAEGMPTHQRTQLYMRLFGEGSFGLRPARLILGRLRDDIHRFPPTELADIVVAARDYAWSNITAYLDVLAHLHSTGASLRDLRGPLDLRDLRGPFDLFDLRGPRDLRGLLGLRGLLDLLDLFDLFDLLSPRDLRGLSGLRGLRRLRGLRDLRRLLDPLDLRGLFDPLGLRGLLDPRGLLGLLDLRDLLDLLDLLGLRGLRDLLDLRDLRGQRRDTLSIPLLLEIAIWVGMAERGLPVEEPPQQWATRSDVKRLAAIAPDFVARTRRVAAEHGYPDPFRPKP